jgi:protocatechuate 3,4-dioxygenase beta subunit
VQNLYAVEIVSPSVANSNNPNEQMLPDYDTDDVNIDLSSGSFSVQLPATALVTGKVVSDGKPVPGTVVFTRPSGIPGRPAVNYQATTDANGAYSILLSETPKAAPYSVRVQPNDSSTFPPITSSTQITGDYTLDFEIPSANEVIALHGTLSNALGGGALGETVELLDADTLTVISTISQTDGQGNFTLLLPVASVMTTTSFELVVLRGDTSTGLVSIAVTLSPDELQAQLIDAVLPLTLPALPSASHLTLTVVGAGSNGTNQPVPNTAVQLIANIQTTSSSTVVQHEVDAQTDAYGQIGVNLYTNDDGARTYTVIVSPSADSQFQSTTTTLTVGPASGVTGNITLGLRPLLTGRVLDPSGTPIDGAVVQPQLSSVAQLASTSASLATAAKIPTTTTDNDGRFALYLDTGSYFLGVIPPATTGLARLWQAPQMVNADTDLGDVTAPTAVMIDGGVFDSAGAPIEATLRLYSVPSSNLSCPIDVTTCLSPPLVIAEGSTGADGRTPLLLPSTPN